VRNQFPIPPLDAKAWRLKIEGAVATPLELDYEELLKVEMRTFNETPECAGNGCAFLKPPSDATLWELGAVGEATILHGGVTPHGKGKTHRIELLQCRALPPNNDFLDEGPARSQHYLDKAGRQ
jgi:hypothetical protein